MDFTNLSIDEQVIKKYQDDEQVMIRLFAVWCLNNDLNAMELYATAYPEQEENTALKKVLNELDEDDRMDIPNETMLDILQIFGNYDLAFVVTEEIKRTSQSKK